MTLPVALVVEGRRCVVAGGGRIALRKIKALLGCGALVTCVSPSFHPEIASLRAACERLTLVRRVFESLDLDGAFLAVAATNDTDANRRICAEAARRSVLCSSVNTPDASSFHSMGIVNARGLTIGISSGGTDPAAVKSMRLAIEEALG